MLDLALTSAASGHAIINFIQSFKPCKIDVLVVYNVSSKLTEGPNQ